jgi:TatA/E family protein of Tat protein translocase
LGEFSVTHLVIILVIVLVLFGPSKLPGLGASFGKAIRGFKAGLNEDPTDTAAQQKRAEQIEASTASAKSADPAKVKDPQSKG